jgi:hypothetical protein
MTNEENMESQAAPTTSPDTAADVQANGVAANGTTVLSAAAQPHSGKSSGSGAPAVDAQEFARRMKGVFMSSNDLACKGPEAAGEFVALIREAVKINQKNALNIMLKQTVQKQHHKVCLNVLWSALSVGHFCPQ